jgi:hypothetical protein
MKPISIKKVAVAILIIITVLGGKALQQTNSTVKVIKEVLHGN